MTLNLFQLVGSFVIDGIDKEGLAERWQYLFLIYSNLKYWYLHETMNYLNYCGLKSWPIVIVLCTVGLYHPPSPKYQTSDLVDFISNSVDFVFTHDSSSIVVVAGDHNQLPDSIFFDLGLDLYIHAPTHRGHFLDKVFATQPIYTTTKTVTSTVKTEHLAKVARVDDLPIIDANKSHRNFTMRKPSPAKNAAFFAATRTYDWSSVLQSDDPQQAADAFYSCTNSLLDLFLTPNQPLL